MAEILSSNLGGFIPTNIANSIIGDVTRGSAVLGLSKSVPMSTPKQKIPVLTNGIGAYWVSETERIQTSSSTWIFPELEAKKLGVIIPMSKEALNDSTIDVFNNLKPYISEAFAVAFDKAAIFGTNTPFGTGQSIYEKAVAAGNEFTEGSVSLQKLDGDISDTMALVEADGFDVNGFLSNIGVKNTLRKFRDDNGDPIFSDIKQDTPAQIYGQTLAYVRNGSFDTAKSKLIGGNFDYCLTGILNGIEYEILKEATLQTVTMADNKPLSLAENDMVALKATMRLGFLVVKDNAFANLKPKSA